MKGSIRAPEIARTFPSGIREDQEKYSAEGSGEYL